VSDLQRYEVSSHLPAYPSTCYFCPDSGNSRNGKSRKTIRGKRWQIEIDVPRDRASEFEPQLIKKGQTRFDGFDDKIISMYARGMTCRKIQHPAQQVSVRR
jgi:putative transposase